MLDARDSRGHRWRRDPTACRAVDHDRRQSRARPLTRGRDLGLRRWKLVLRARGRGAAGRERASRTDVIPAGDQPRPPRVVLFDLDGVLVNSAKVVEESWRQWATNH